MFYHLTEPSLKKSFKTVQLSRLDSSFHVILSNSPLHWRMRNHRSSSYLRQGIQTASPLTEESSITTMEWYNPAIQNELAAEGNEIINFILRTHVRRQESRQKRESCCLQSWKIKNLLYNPLVFWSSE